MVNVDELNEEIKQFGVVVDKMNELPEIYEKVQIQLDVCREAANELKITREDMSKFMSETTQTIDQQHKETKATLSSVEYNLDQQIDTKTSSAEHNLGLRIDKSEGTIKDRVSLAESNLSLALTNLTHTVENTSKELNQRLDFEAAESKKRFIIIVIGVCISIILSIVGLFV